MAAAAGIPRTAAVRTVEEFVAAFEAARASAQLTTIVAKVEAVGPRAFVTDLPMLENRFQFQRHLRAVTSNEQ
jgi:sulfopyruvate decarboxylase subunit beta